MILDHLPAVKALPTGEKWELLNELWSDLVQAVEDAPPDPLTVAVLEEREAEYLAEPKGVRTWSEVRARLAAHKQARRTSP